MGPDDLIGSHEYQMSHDRFYAANAVESTEQFVTTKKYPKVRVELISHEPRKTIQLKLEL